MADRKQRFGLVTYFEKVQQRVTGSKTTINRYSGQWDADAILESYGYDKSKELIDRYFKIATSPSWKRFAYDVEKVYDGMREEIEDKKQREVMRQRAKEWLQ